MVDYTDDNPLDCNLYPVGSDGGSAAARCKKEFELLQQAFEKWFGHPNLPYGGMVAALTWGLVHILTKGNLSAGIIGAVSGLLYGTVYLLANRNVRIAFPVLVVMFVL